MHELALVKDIIEAITAKVEKDKGDSCPKRINILIGELEHISPEHFEYHFREQTRGTYLENAALNFKRIEARFKCKDCGFEFLSQEATDGCPRCNSRINDVITGSGVYVESVELD